MAMAPRVLIMAVCLMFMTLARTAVPPISTAPSQPSGSPTLPVSPNTTSIGEDLVILTVPGTKTSIHFKKYGNLLNQGELDLCIIEALGSIFATTIMRGKDGFLPLHMKVYRYGDVEIHVEDFSSPTFRMTYGILVSTLRGIALFASLYGYVEMKIDIYDGKWGHVGTGELGEIQPSGALANGTLQDFTPDTLRIAKEDAFVR